MLPHSRALIIYGTLFILIAERPGQSSAMMQTFKAAEEAKDSRLAAPPGHDFHSQFLATQDGHGNGLLEQTTLMPEARYIDEHGYKTQLAAGKRIGRQTTRQTGEHANGATFESTSDVKWTTTWSSEKKIAPTREALLSLVNKVMEPEPHLLEAPRSHRDSPALPPPNPRFQEVPDSPSTHPSQPSANTGAQPSYTPPKANNRAYPPPSSQAQQPPVQHYTVEEPEDEPPIQTTETEDHAMNDNFQRQASESNRRDDHAMNDNLQRQASEPNKRHRTYGAVGTYTHLNGHHYGGIEMNNIEYKKFKILMQRRMNLSPKDIKKFEVSLKKSFKKDGLELKDGEQVDQLAMTYHALNWLFVNKQEHPLSKMISEASSEVKVTQALNNEFKELTPFETFVYNHPEITPTQEKYFTKYLEDQHSANKISMPHLDHPNIERLYQEWQDSKKGVRFHLVNFWFNSIGKTRDFFGKMAKIFKKSE
ncbi:hypothetical protein MJO28_015952 [Puccinia striiformis f. sp. tritici]|uniref:Uncharacterized protein n=1 Tax=Puccinia striiformis f. sp. tritici TaxID=168172 RepID=A0ACC0DQC0_9BASI|nr:hypothetical protein Pst134EB_029717 [Puccinia striiformis f. sp. tritici]KAI7936138.1 hypothetical protein MJO29_015441 [Puccinia striiformis f. sp. tritici]KAI7937053.1 hypothetical protein MJO28_015952 [Puccinia striiformis f. sp. tritici]